MVLALQLLVMKGAVMPYSSHCICAVQVFLNATAGQATICQRIDVRWGGEKEGGGLAREGGC